MREYKSTMRSVIAISAGLIAWGLIVSVINFGLRLSLTDYTDAEKTLLFTTPMKIARLCMAAMTSVVAGGIVRWLAPNSRYAAWAVGVVLLLVFVPTHVQLWDRFPIWYHLMFLMPLAPLVAVGAWLTRPYPPT